MTEQKEPPRPEPPMSTASGYILAAVTFVSFGLIFGLVTFFFVRHHRNLAEHQRSLETTRKRVIEFERKARLEMLKQAAYQRAGRELAVLHKLFLRLALPQSAADKNSLRELDENFDKLSNLVAKAKRSRKALPALKSQYEKVAADGALDSEELKDVLAVLASFMDQESGQ